MLHSKASPITKWCILQSINAQFCSKLLMWLLMKCWCSGASNLICIYINKGNFIINVEVEDSHKVVTITYSMGKVLWVMYSGGAMKSQKNNFLIHRVYRSLPFAWMTWYFASFLKLSDVKSQYVRTKSTCNSWTPVMRDVYL